MQHCPRKRGQNNALCLSDHWTVFCNAKGCLLVKFGHERKPSTLHITFSNSRIFIVLYVTNVRGRERSSCSMTVHDFRLLNFAWRGFRRTAGNFSPIHPTVWNWHPWLPSVWISKNRMWGQQFATNDTVQESVHCHFPPAASRYSGFQNSTIIALTRMGILYSSEYSAQIWLTCGVFLCVAFPDWNSDHQVPIE